MQVKWTRDLETGDRVLLPNGAVRTVAEVRSIGFDLAMGEETFVIVWAEGPTPEWGSVTTAGPGFAWQIELRA